MNVLIAFVTVALLLTRKTYSVPVDVTGFDEFTGESPTTIITSTTTTTTTTTLAPEVNREWEDLVLAGPTVVNYLRLFMVFASNKSQSLTLPTGNNVQYFRNVTSLRTILLQIASEMESAFQVARDDLIRTRVSMEQIPDHIKSGLLLIQTARSDLLKKLLPYTIRNVDRAANEGSAVAKPTLERFFRVGSLLEEFFELLNATTSGNADYLTESKSYATDIKTQWELLVELFKKFSERADITQQSINNSFITPIKQAEEANGFSSEVQRTGELGKLIPAAILIDQSAYLLGMMARIYIDVSDKYMVNLTASSANYLDIPEGSKLLSNQRTLWQNIVSQSVKVAQLAQKSHDEFVGTGAERDAEYAIVPTNLPEVKLDNERLIEKWQDWVLANVICVNYLNSLMVLTSRRDFVFIIPTNYSVKYIQNTGSLNDIISHLSKRMDVALHDARINLQHLHTGMKDIPDNLKNMVFYLKELPFEILLQFFPDLFNKVEKLVNESLVVVRKPEKSFQQVLGLLTEIDDLLSIIPTDELISMQISDVKTQWTDLTELITELAKQAEIIREGLLLQINWILNGYIQAGVTLANNTHNLMISLIIPKIVEIDRTSDLLEMITKTYTYISTNFTDVVLGSNGHLLKLSNEEERKRYLKQFRYGFVPDVVNTTRVSLKEHVEFLKRDTNRHKNYEEFK